jgi:hypothetical protein
MCKIGLLITTDIVIGKMLGNEADIKVGTSENLK